MLAFPRQASLLSSSFWTCTKPIRDKRRAQKHRLGTQIDALTASPTRPAKSRRSTHTLLEPGRARKHRLHRTCESFFSCEHQHDFECNAYTDRRAHSIVYSSRWLLVGHMHQRLQTSRKHRVPVIALRLPPVFKRDGVDRLNPALRATEPLCRSPHVICSP